MPVAKKTRRKTPVKSRAKAEVASPLPDRRAMESFLAAITKSRADDASEKAQDLVYTAWEATSPRKRIALARKALRAAVSVATMGISALSSTAYPCVTQKTGDAQEIVVKRSLLPRTWAASPAELNSRG